MGRGGLRVKIGHHKIGACAEKGQNRIWGGWGVKKSQKTSDIIYVRSLIEKKTPCCIAKNSIISTSYNAIIGHSPINLVVIGPL